LFGVTARFVRRNVGYPIRINSSKSREKLGLTYRNIDDTVRDMVEQMESNSMLLLFSQ
jgi:dihydroflavonol-4-reductase